MDVRPTGGDQRSTLGRLRLVGESLRGVQPAKSIRWTDTTCPPSTFVGGKEGTVVYYLLLIMKIIFRDFNVLTYIPTLVNASSFYTLRNFTNGNTKEEEPIYEIGGQRLTISAVRDISPIDRRVAHWALLVDWDLQRQRPYVIVDPYDPEGLLYLSRSEYLAQVKVCASNDLTLIVVARPGSTQPQPLSQNSPPKTSSRVPFDSGSFFRDPKFRFSWQDFLRLRQHVRKHLEVEDGMVTESHTTVTRTVLLWVTQLLHYSAVKAPERRLQGFNPFAQHISHVSKASGIQFTAKQLKIALFAVYSYLSGNPLESTEPLGLRIRLTCGLPAMIPRPYRDLIRKGNLTWIRIWVSLLNSYRSFKVPAPDPETAYATIRKSHPDLSKEPLFERWQYFCKEIFPTLVKGRGELPAYTYEHNRGLIVRSAAANFRGIASLESIIFDAKAWRRAPENLPRLWFLLHKDRLSADLMDKISQETHFGDTFYRGDVQLEDILNEYWDLPVDGSMSMVQKSDTKIEISRRLEAAQKAAGLSGGLIGHAFDARKIAHECPPAVPPPTNSEEAAKNCEVLEKVNRENLAELNYSPITGRLFNFLAPGGKLRTVAICDYWTQMCTRSVHDHLFKILKILHLNDATFDQQETVDTYWARQLAPHWSFDLSAATDSIPLALYIECLAPFLIREGETYDDGYNRSKLWARLMTERDFAIPSPKKGELGFDGTHKYRSIRYGTGQPMGAYSSWASMALVHHALVQFSAWLNEMPSAPQHNCDKGGAVWFDSYLVLGDDVDIALCPITANNYQVVCAAFQIKIGLAKSLRSNKNFFEFANQRFCEEGNISPLSLLEEATSVQSWNRRVEYASRIASRFGVTMNENNLVRLVSTARQWASIIPELSGYRPLVIFRLMRFILLNPLKPVWHSEAELNIRSIVLWISQLQELVTSVASDSCWLDLEVTLAGRVREMCLGYIRRHRDSIPKSQHYFAYDDSVARFLESLGTDRTALVYKPQRGRRYALPRSKFAWSYIEFCIFRFNEDLRRKLRTCERDLFKLESLTKNFVVTSEIDPAWEARLALTTDMSKDPKLADWIKLWFELGNLPKPIIINNNDLASSLRGVDKTAKEEVETAEQLLKVIIPSFAECLGVEIAGVPYFRVTGSMGGSWQRMVRSLLRSFNHAVKARAHHPNLFGLCSRWFSPTLAFASRPQLEPLDTFFSAPRGIPVNDRSGKAGWGSDTRTTGNGKPSRDDDSRYFERDLTSLDGVLERG